MLLKLPILSLIAATDVSLALWPLPYSYETPAPYLISKLSEKFIEYPTPCFRALYPKELV